VLHLQPNPGLRRGDGKLGFNFEEVASAFPLQKSILHNITASAMIKHKWNFLGGRVWQLQI
jgi:hypothetical protein